MKPQRLYDNQTLSEENFNRIVNLISKIENKEIQIDENGMNFLDGDDFEGSIISLDRDEVNRIVSITQEIKETTDRTPFENIEDNLVYENELIYNVDNTSDYQVLRISDGTIVPSTNYSINKKGQVRFSNEYSEDELLVTGLDYWIQKTMYIGRDEDGNIMKISMEPIEELGSNIEQDLVPIMLSNNDEVYFEPRVSENHDDEDPIISNNYYTSLNRMKESFEEDGYSKNQYSVLHNFILDFKENVAVTKMIIRIFDNQYTRFPLSFDLFGSNDKSSWSRILRVRNIEEDDYETDFDKTFIFDIQNPLKLRFLKLDMLSHYKLNLDGIQILGHLSSNENKRYGRRLLGPTTGIIQEKNDDDEVISEYNGVSKSSVKNGSIGDRNVDRIVDSSGIARRFGLNDSNSHIQMEFNEKAYVDKYKTKMRYSDRSYKIRFLGSNQGKEWELLDEWTRLRKEQDEYDNEIIETRYINKPKYFKYYRIKYEDLEDKERNASIRWIELFGKRKGE